MEHIALEVFDRETKNSKYAVLEPSCSITVINTSEIFASGDVWSYSFRLSIPANLHIFGTAGDLHGTRLHEQINKRRARLWVDGMPLHLGYLKLDDEVEQDADEYVSVILESGQKTFEEMIEGINATDVSVGDVVIGIALNRKRVVQFDDKAYYVLNGLKAYTKDERLIGVDQCAFLYQSSNQNNCVTPYTQRWPKFVKSHGKVWNSSWVEETKDYTNVYTPYDNTPEHSFCNINICYPLKTYDGSGNEVAGRGYTVRLAHGDGTTDGGDNQTRFNNAPNFYLLYFIDRMFKDMGIQITENQAKSVEDLKRVFMLNYGCHYEEIENDNAYYHSNEHNTPSKFSERYGQYYMPIVDVGAENRLLKNWDYVCKPIRADKTAGKVLLRDVVISKGGSELMRLGSVEGIAYPYYEAGGGGAIGPEPSDEDLNNNPFRVQLQTTQEERDHDAYSAYLAYATSDNYPNVEISEVVNAMKSMFGVRLLFNNDYKTVRIVLLKNIFQNQEVQNIKCEIVNQPEKVENNIRGFRMTYGKGKDDTNYYYKGFNDMLSHTSTIWSDKSDKHDYSQWSLNAVYDEIKQHVSGMNRTCYVTPLTGNSFIIKVDEDEDVLFPTLLEAAPFIDAEDGDCSYPESEGKTVEEVQCGASPVIMNDVNGTYASLFSGDLKAPTPYLPGTVAEDMTGPTDPDVTGPSEPAGEAIGPDADAIGAAEGYEAAFGQKIATFGRATKESTVPANGGHEVDNENGFVVTGKLDVYISEGFQIRMEDNYGISNGGTPFDEANPGLQFGIMRSSGSDSSVWYFTDPDDENYNGSTNDAWDVIPGSGAISHPDTCDNYGILWDYNGDNPGVGPTEGRLSLKLRAEKPNPYYVEGSNDPAKKDRYLTITGQNLQGRGLADTLYKEFSLFIRNARIVKLPVRMELAQLLAIDKTKRVRVGDIMGFIRKMKYTINNQTGLGEVELEIMYI